MEKKWISAVCDTTEMTYVSFTTLVRDQEVEGSNPFAPTTPKVYSPERSFTERSGDIAYTLGPKGLSKGCRVLSSRSI